MQPALRRPRDGGGQVGWFKIGVMADSFRLDIREGIRKARELGADGVQVYAVSGEISPQALDRRVTA